MKAWRTEIAVLGSGFAGCLTALVLRQLGRDVLVLDRARHPRFAIGESSTPIANQVLRHLAETYELPELLPLARYGTWQQAYPEIVSGLKRGFSYFHHHPLQEFESDSRYSNQLLVAASSEDQHSDTQWFRADVDTFFADQVQRAGIPLLEETYVERFEGREPWCLQATRDNQPLRIEADFLVDATGPGTALARHLNVDRGEPLRTNSRAVFSHLTGVERWHDVLASVGVAIDDHPFLCDHAALHHLLDGAWMWMLRFNNGVTSCGFVLDNERHAATGIDPATEWSQWLERYPTISRQLKDAQVVDPPGRFLGSGRLQRRCQGAAGADWALLPHAYGFVDPLHSSGIAHTLCGIERLSRAFRDHWRTGGWEPALDAYNDALARELQLIDELVCGCYRALGTPRLVFAYSMLYFAAATSYEHRRHEGGAQAGNLFLCADDDRLIQIVQSAREQLWQLTSNQPNETAVRQYEYQLAESLRPYNRVGLFEPPVPNMYRYTAAPL